MTSPKRSAERPTHGARRLDRDDAAQYVTTKFSFASWPANSWISTGEDVGWSIVMSGKT